MTEEMSEAKDLVRLAFLEADVLEMHKEIVSIKRKYGIGIYCCRTAETSNGWHHNGDCKNWVLTW